MILMLLLSIFHTITPLYPSWGDIRWASGTVSPYLSLATNQDRITDSSVLTYTVTLTNYGNIPLPYTVTLDLPPTIELVEAGDFSDGMWQGEIEGGNFTYELAQSAKIPYLHLAEHGVKSLCELRPTPETGCDNLIIPFNLGTLGYHANLFETVNDYWYVSTDGVILGATNTISTSTAENRPIPRQDGLNDLIAPFWRDNVLSQETESGVYAAIVKGLTPSAESSFYVQWHNVALATNPQATARYAVAIDLNTEEGLIYFIYDHLNRIESSPYTIGIEEADGIRGYGYGYAGAERPYGHPPFDGETVVFRPNWTGANFTRQLIFHARATQRGDHRVTVYSETTGKTSWATGWINRALPAKIYLPIVME